MIRNPSRVAVVLASAAALFAQTLTSSFTGTVLDASGAVVSGAKVTVTSADTGVIVWQGRTDGTGLFRAPAIPAGRYNLTFEATGFQKHEVQGVALAAEQRLRTDATLRPGELQQSITVTAEAGSPLDRDSAVIGAVIDPSQISDLPLSGRNLINLLSLVNGATHSGSGSSVPFWQLSFNGTRTLNYEFTLDGLSVVSGITGNVGTLPSPDAVREFRVQTSGYSAEYGRTSGATVSAITLSGTNEFHGALYTYVRNEAMNANAFFNNARSVARPRDRYLQPGGRLGGPVLLPKIYDGHNRTFFFYNYEKLMRRVPSVPSATIPEAPLRAGDFSSSPVVVNDPVAGTPFPGNRIPASRTDPAATRVLSLLPSPNSPGVLDAVNNRRLNNLVSSQILRQNSVKHTGRIDHSIGAAVRLFGSVNYFDAPTENPFNIPGPLNNNIGNSELYGFQASIGYTHTIRPTFIVESRLGFFREFNRTNPPTLGLDVAALTGIRRNPAAAIPRFSIAGWPEYGTNLNTYRTEVNNTWQGGASATWVRGPHLMKFGFQLRKNQFNAFNPGGSWMGVYSFNGEITAPNRTGGIATHGLADFLLGAVKTSVYDLPQPPTGRRNHNFGLFFQDDWKATSRLTVNAGLRYEYEAPMHVATDIYSRIDVVSGKLLAAGKNASRTLNLKTPRFNLAPRLGLAFSFSDKTVVRSAFGVFYGQVFSNLGGITAYPGYLITQNFSNLGTGVAQPFRLSEGVPLTAVQDLNDPFLAERNATVFSPLTSAASYGSVNPLSSTYQWNFGIQRRIGWGIVADASYVGTRGLHLPLFLNANGVPLERGEELAFLNNFVETQRARRFPTVSNFGALHNAGDSIYHSLQLNASRQLAKGVSFRVVYTWSKTIDDGSGIFNYSQPNGIDAGQFPEINRRVDRSLSSFDMPHNFTAAVQYVTRGPKGIRGWEINPILVARSGLTDTINQTNLHPSATQQRPNVANSSSIYASQMTSEGTAVRYLIAASSPGFPYTPTGPLFVGTGSARRQVAPFSLGSLGRNTVRNPGQTVLDLSIGRKIPLKEQVSLGLRFEAYNALNQTNFGSVSTGLAVAADASGRVFWNAPGFGLITGTRNARFMQLVARLEF